MRVLIVLLTTLLLVACGDDDPATPERAGATIEHKFGETEVPADPQRVVAVGFNDQDFALALGVVPVGIRQFQAGIDITGRPWAQDALGGAEPEIIGAEELEFEKIAELRPDLILAVYSGISDTQYDTLSKLAPTVAQSDEYIDYGEPWQSQLERTGRALGREDEAARLQRDVEQEFAQTREAHPELEGKTMVFGYGSRQQLGVLSADDQRARFFTDLGLTIPAGITKLAGEEFSKDISSENARLLDQDVVVVYGQRDELERNPLFSRLDAVRDGRVVYVDDDPDLANAIGFSSPLSIPFAIDTIIGQLQEKLS